MRERERQRGNAGERERIISKTKKRQNRTGGQHQMAVKTLWPMRKERERKTKKQYLQSRKERGTSIRSVHSEKRTLQKNNVRC
jgi:hypothetical protein